MSWIFSAFQKCFTFGTASNDEPHVSFSPSTLDLERERTMRNIASPLPFQNFLNELRLNALQDFGKGRMTLRESAVLRKSGWRLWSLLTESQKEKYRQLAINAKNTRVPVLMVSAKKSTPHLQKPNMPGKAHSDTFMECTFMPNNSRRPKTTLSEEYVHKAWRKQRPKLGTKHSKKKILKNSLRKSFKKPLLRSKSTSLSIPMELPTVDDISTPPQTSQEQSTAAKTEIYKIVCGCPK